MLAALAAPVVILMWMLFNPFAAGSSVEARQVTPSAGRVAFGPTKFAQLIPTDTPTPTNTPTLTPSATPTASPTPTAQPTKTPILVPTVVPTLGAAVMAAPAAVPTLAAFVSGEQYSALSIAGDTTNRPAAQHPDLNLAVRGWEPTRAPLRLVDYTGQTDDRGPQLAGLFSDNRAPQFTSAYRVYDWNWSCDCRGDLVTDWPVTLIGIATTPNELIHTPDANLDIGNGYVALVLYADANRITLKYTREDSVARGYTVQLEDVTIDTNLLALYQLSNRSGRSDLPALRPNQVIGTARGNEILVAVRDTGAFMDPRAREDWWQGK